jgi:hypothetical protein
MNLNLLKEATTQWEQINQVKVVMVFSSSTWLSIAIDVFCGSMKETKIIKYFLDWFPNKDIGFIMDRGFSDYGLFLDLKKQKIHYIAALKKNAKVLSFKVRMTGAFICRKRNIVFFKKTKISYGFLYLFEDPKLRGDEENFLLS